VSLVVIGGNAAGLSAAARARRIDPHLKITVLERGSTISYSSCGIPYYVEGRVHSLDELVMHTPEYFRRERNIEVRTGTDVAAIRHPQRELSLAGGERIPYERLVIATGARAGNAGIRGADQPHVFTLQSFDDAERMKRFLQDRKPKTAAVIGAGYIGLEAADVLRAHGIRVTLFQEDDRILGVRDAGLRQALLARFQRFGVEFRPNEAVRTIENLSVNGVEAGVAVVAAGFQPNVELAQDAGVEIGQTGAIRVSERQETNLHGVFAAGDCAEAIHQITGRPAYIPLGTTANKTGRVAGANAAGRRERFAGVMGTSIVRVCGLGAGMTGLSPSQAAAEGFDAVSAAVEARERPSYFWGTQTRVELVAERRSGRLLGGSVIGERGVAGRTNVIAAALQGRLRADEMEQMDLAYAPPYASVWDPLLIAVQQLRKLID